MILKDYIEVNSDISYVNIDYEYDAKYGIVLKVIKPNDGILTLGKSWLMVKNKKVRIPSFIQKFKGDKIEIYQDEFGGNNELFRIRSADKQFNSLNRKLRKPYNPTVSSDGKMHISLAYARDFFVLKQDLYASVIYVNNNKIVVQIFGGYLLVKGEKASKLIISDLEFVSKSPITKGAFKFIESNACRDILIIQMRRI